MRSEIKIEVKEEVKEEMKEVVKEKVLDKQGIFCAPAASFNPVSFMTSALFKDLPSYIKFYKLPY